VYGAATGRIRRSSPSSRPDDALLFDLLTDWAPDEKVRHRNLVENPASLYDFAKG
jgi:D-galactarolactone isomerase